MSDFNCACCGGQSFVRALQVPEMYFGSKDLFQYRECRACGSLNIARIPTELSVYYRAGYGGHSGSASVPAQSSRLRRFLRRRRTEFLLTERGLLGRLVGPLSADYFPYPWSWLRSANVSLDSSILDVGCGGGSLLKTLHACGFTNLYGIDAFVPDELSVPGLRVVRQTALEVQGQFDFVMLHHSFEHMPEPLVTLRHLAGLLSDDGVILIRVPVASCEAFQMFAEHWYQIDAPRHLFIPTTAGIDSIASRAGLRVFRTDFDSTAAQFVVSEGYRLGLSLTEQKNRNYSHVLPERLADYEAMTVRANMNQVGDQAAFFLRMNG